MGLDVFDARQIGGVGIGPLHRENLAFLPRSPEALALAVAGDAQAADHRPDAIAVGDRPRERLEHDRDVALGGDQAVGRLAERARAGVADRLGGRKKDQAVRLAIGGAADDGLIDSSLEQRPGGDRHGLQRRRAGGVHHQERPVELERLLHDLRGAERPQIERLPGLTARVAPADRLRHLRRHRVDVGAEQHPRRFDLRQERRRLVDPGRIDDVADLRAATCMPHVDAGASVGRHREGIEAGIPAGL